MINDEKSLTDDQIVKKFSDLVKENGEVKFDINDPVRLSDRCIKNFIYRRFSGRRLYKILDRSDTDMYLEKENISIKRNGGYITFSYASGKKQIEFNIIKQFIELVKQNKKIIFKNSDPGSSALIDNFMKENNLTEIDFGFLLEEYRDLIRKDIYLIERNDIRRYSFL